MRSPVCRDLARDPHLAGACADRHRLATAADSDLIVVLGDGRLLEVGTHTELLARDDGAYRALWAAYVGQSAQDSAPVR